MRNPRLNRIGGLLGAGFLASLLLYPGLLSGQSQDHVFGTGVLFQSYSFNEALGAEVANLTMIPAAYTLPLGDRLSMDFYGAWARGAVEKDGVTYELTGPVDTRVRASFQLTSGVVLTSMVNLPTGNSAHNAEEAVVASVLSTDILGFQEANWGTGTAVTTGLVSAYEAGDWALGMGVSYRLSNGFEPAEDVNVTYEPGNEIRVRVGLDRNVGTDGKLTLGMTYQNFSEDQYDGQNLFQPGNRIRGDLSYAFRTGGSTWALYAVDVWRDSGDAFLDLIDAGGAVLGDTTVTFGSQNLMVVGLNGSALLGGSLRIRPSLDFRYQTREEENGEGWLAGGGFDIPLRLSGSYQMYPRVRASFGSLKAFTGENETLWGLELGLTARFRL